MLIKILLIGGLLATQASFAHGPEPMPLIGVPIPHVDGTLNNNPVNFLPDDGSDPIVINKEKAIALGKALFWDMSVGSDGMACGSCHAHAGADNRIKNQVNPGVKSLMGVGTEETFESLPSGVPSGPNHALTADDFPTYRFADPLYKESGKTFSTDDAVASAGTYSGEFKTVSKFGNTQDVCERSADPIFNIHGNGTRRVEPRNTPTMINAVFNYRSFWDGRANNIFNGVNGWGDRDDDAGIWTKINARTVAKQKLRLRNASLASLAVGPPLNELEMACRNRVWPSIGRKLLLRQPLADQKVHYQDSVLGPYSLSTQGNLQNGLNTTYKALVTQAFNPKFWSYSRIGSFGAPAGEMPYNQMEANFSMFFGIALQLYQATLVSDQAPIDLTERDPASMYPTWTFPASTGIVKSDEERALLDRGYHVFVGAHCNICHAGPVLSTAALESNSTIVTPTPGKTFGPSWFPIAYGPNAMDAHNGAAASGIWPTKNVVNRDDTTDRRKLMDMGFTNTGVNDPLSDPGLLGVDDYGNPLSFSEQYLQYLLGPYADTNKPIVDSDVLTNVRSCDFYKPLAKVQITQTSDTFKLAKDVQIDGSREGNEEAEARRAGCLNPPVAGKVDGNNYIPTAEAARDALGTAKMAVAVEGAFKVPSLRNAELTGPYMHNGSMATLEQVVEFYTRNGNVVFPENKFQHSIVSAVLLKTSLPPDHPDYAADVAALEYDRKALVAFLKSFTDDRVRYEKAPFDHPEVIVPHGHLDPIEAGNQYASDLAKEEYLHVPALGANGAFEADGVTPKALLPFENILTPTSVQ